MRNFTKLLKSEKPKCLFTEPQFNPGSLNTIAQTAGIKIMTLDPLSTNIVLGRDHYFNMMNNITNTLAACSHE